MVRRAVLAALVLFPVFAFAQGGAFQGTVSGNSTNNPDLAGVGIDQKIGTKVPMDVAFQDDNGKPTDFAHLLHGRPVVLLPIFYRCNGVCTIEMQGVLNALMKNQDLRPGRDLDVVAMSLNPKETPSLAAAKKAEYVGQYGHTDTAKGWTLLTGSQSATQKVATEIGFKYTYDPEKDRVNHPSAVYILTPTGRVSTLMVEGMYPSQKFVDDVRRAAKDELGEPLTDTAWLGCVHIDPVTGKRSLMVQGVVRLLGVLTIMAVLTTMVVQNRRKRSSAV